jgi:DNA-binding MarR family transcriptional regulator
MTETRIEAGPLIPVGMAIGQTVGQAEAVMTRLLAGVLAETGTARQTYLALQRLLVHGDSALREDYIRDLSDWLDLDLWSAGELADDLVADGLLVLADENIRLAEAGSELRERIRGAIAEITAPLYAELDPADIETTVRTLRELTKLTRALYPAAAPADADGGRR